MSKSTIKKLENYLRKAVGYVGIVEGVTNAIHLPVAIRTGIVAACGLLISVDHFVSNPNQANAVATVKAAETVVQDVTKA